MSDAIDNTSPEEVVSGSENVKDTIEPSLTREEEEQLLKSLRDLGYVE